MADKYEGVPPLLVSLIRNVRANPVPDDIALMKQTDVKELRMFFDALASGQDERKTYENILAHLRARRDGPQREAEERAKREAEEKKKKEDAAAQKRMAEEAAARDREAAERRKAEDKARADAAAAKAADAERLRLEEEKRRLEALEAKRREAEEAERARRRVGTCAHCKQFIEDRDFLENGDMKLHTRCLEAWQASNCPRCAHCQAPVVEDYVEAAAPSGGSVTLHPDCLDAYKRATRPKCAKCGEVIMDNSRMTLGADHFHVKCAPTQR